MFQSIVSYCLTSVLNRPSREGSSFFSLTWFAFWFNGGGENRANERARNLRCVIFMIALHGLQKLKNCAEQIWKWQIGSSSLLIRSITSRTSVIHVQKKSPAFTWRLSFNQLKLYNKISKYSDFSFVQYKTLPSPMNILSEQKPLTLKTH